MTIDHCDVAALSEKFRKFGVLGAGLVRAPVATARLDEVNTVASTPVCTAARPSSAADVAELLRDMAIWTSKLRKAITRLAASLYDSEPLSFTQLYEKVASLGFDKNPAESRGLSESDIQRLAMQFQEDETVREAAETFMQSQAGVDVTEEVEVPDATDIDLGKILKVHKQMNDSFTSLVKEFARLGEEERHQMIPRLVESTAEVAVSLETYRKFGLKSDSVERAVTAQQEELSKSKKFQAETEKLAETMKELYQLTRPRLSRSEFLEALKAIVTTTSDLKALSAELHAQALAGDVVAAYQRFSEFSENQSKNALLSNPFEARDLLERHLQSSNEESAKELSDAWEATGLELSMFMQAVMMMQQDPSIGMPPPPPTGLFKKKNLPSAKEVVQLQEAIVVELINLKEKIQEAVDAGNAHKFKAETLVAFAQACASGVIEKKFGHASDSLTIAGFKYGMVLSKEQRFVDGSMAQQNALVEIAQMIPESADDNQGCCIM